MEDSYGQKWENNREKYFTSINCSVGMIILNKIVKLRLATRRVHICEHPFSERPKRRAYQPGRAYSVKIVCTAPHALLS